MVSEGVVDEVSVLEQERAGYGYQHYEQKQSASHRWGTCFMFVEFGENFRFFSGGSMIADGFPSFNFFEEFDVEGVEDQGGDQCDECKA